MADFFYGVIEGFYGQQWSWQQRLDYAGFLAEQQFDCYIYAPKGESALRSQWRSGLYPDLLARLGQLGDHYRNSGVRWGLGLSPLGLSEQFTETDKADLGSVVEQINSLQPDLLCILFDDMRGDIPGLAQRQMEIVDTVLSCSGAGQHLVCPTYYSFDPVLEQVFGPMPPHYLEELGDGLPDGVDVFWTGDRVISESVSGDSIDRAAALLGRAPALWDNYPVNDGRLTSNFLHLRPYSGRSGSLREQLSAHIVNPMNQPHLSRLVLSTLASLYRHPQRYSVDTAWEEVLSTIAEPGFANCLRRDAGLFQQRGLEGLSAQHKRDLSAEYAGFQDPAAAEIVHWLAGAYAFDPACLTG